MNIRGVMFYSTENSLRFFVATIFCLMILGITSSSVLAAPTLTNLSCGAVSATASWPRNTFKTTCTMDITVDGETGLFVGAYVGDYITTKNSGNGSNITLTGPEHRLNVDGPLQGGTPANVTTSNTGAAVTQVQNGINVDVSGLTVDVEYTTYEADLGDTNYTQNFTFAVYRDGTAAVSTQASSMTFTIANKQYIAVSAAPSVTLTSSSEIFSVDQYYDSNNITVSVKANNTWKLQAKVAGNLSDGGTKTIPITSTYFSCSGAGFNNLAAARTQFAVADTYYDAAQETGGDFSTGTSDNISLDAKNVTTTYSLKTTSTFEKAIYTSDTTFNLISPR